VSGPSTLLNSADPVVRVVGDARYRTFTGRRVDPGRGPFGKRETASLMTRTVTVSIVGGYPYCVGA
jgi:hypothetical protein